MLGEMPGADSGFTGPTWISKDYQGQPGFHGQANFKEAELQALADHVARNGSQLGLHTIGDAAINMTVRVWRRVAESSAEDAHWYLPHFALLPAEETLATMARVGILANARPNFLCTLESRYVDNLEGDMLEHNNPVSVPLRHGVHGSFGSDNLPVDPRVGLYAPHHQGPLRTRVYGPQEPASIQEAIRPCTRLPEPR